jgi:hypothetical protein
MIAPLPFVLDIWSATSVRAHVSDPRPVAVHLLAIEGSPYAIEGS